MEQIEEPNLKNIFIQTGRVLPSKPEKREVICHLCLPRTGSVTGLMLGAGLDGSSSSFHSFQVIPKATRLFPGPPPPLSPQPLLSTEFWCCQGLGGDSQAA